MVIVTSPLWGPHHGVITVPQAQTRPTVTRAVLDLVVDLVGQVLIMALVVVREPQDLGELIAEVVAEPDEVRHRLRAATVDLATL
jgi:hypothetical protein